jgi:glutamine---fructose-6-phosphate transaminase (isomerizing)
MCGIFGIVGAPNPLEVCLAGLKRLEYRGYDSAGIAGIANGTLHWCKEVGKISCLEQKIRRSLVPLELAIGHTRWATHGLPTDRNAHPHFDDHQTLALVHNGIIENCDLLREQLKRDGKQFLSDTDTEVIAQLIGTKYRGNVVAAIRETLPLLKGSFAFALIHKEWPKHIFAAAYDCPLCIGYNEQRTESILASDLNAFLTHTNQVLFLQKGEIAQIAAEHIEVFDATLHQVEKKVELLERNFSSPSKEGYEHFMLKEIFEQDRILQKVLRAPFSFPPDEVLLDVNKIWMIGCGSSSYAASIGTLLFEELAAIPAMMDLASEARYRSLQFAPDTFVIAISQSGETADTLAAVREAKKNRCKVLGICNVKNSQLTREADYLLHLEAGPEISVTSTKAFSAEVAVLLLFVLHVARLRSRIEGTLAKELPKIPGHVQQVLQNAAQIRTLAKKYAHFHDFFFMGRRHMVPTCLEAALKLKEISYVNANGYAAGELKHGPIALLSPRFPVVAFCANQQTQEKMLSTLKEVKAREAPLLVIAPEDFRSVTSVADDIVWVPSIPDPLAPFASTVAGQLFAYYIAKERGCDIDQPRNLAKSVTVE